MPLTVLHVITRMVRGGAQENTLATVRGMAAPAWRSVLAAGPAVGPEGSMEEELRDLGDRFLPVPELVRELRPLQDHRALQRLTALMREVRPDLVHTHTSKAGVLGRLAARTVGIPAVHTPHGHVFHGYAGAIRTRLFIGAERWCASMARRLVALTPAERDEHLALRIGRPEQWRVIHSGIDFTPFEAARGRRAEVRAELGIPEADPVIGTVGRLVEIKGQSVLLEAFGRVASRRPRLHLVLVGDGPLRDSLVGRARAAGASVRGVEGEGVPAGERPTVHFLGLRSDVPRILAALDLFVLPSLNEGMGRALVEAMAMELPCIGSRVSGIPDVIDEGRTGLLVPPADPEALAVAVDRLLDERELARQMGALGRRKAVPAYGVQAMVDALEGLYREVLDECRGAAGRGRCGGEHPSEPAGRPGDER